MVKAKAPHKTPEEMAVIIKEVLAELAKESALQASWEAKGFYREDIVLFRTLCRYPKAILSQGGPNATWKTRLKFRMEVSADLGRIFRLWCQMKVLRLTQTGLP
jgi:hypothetical protein